MRLCVVLALSVMRTFADGVGNASNHGLHDFAAQLYCAGAVEQRCPDGQNAGVCYWYRNERGGALVPLRPDEVNRSSSTSTSRMPSDRWDPVRSKTRAFHFFDRAAADKCLAGKRIHVAGDSTSRDTFYELMAVGGHPLFADGSGEWTAGRYEPRTPVSSGGRDKQGQCLGDMGRGWWCVRDERHISTGNVESRTTFQFLMRSNSSWEGEQIAGKLSPGSLGTALDVPHAAVGPWTLPSVGPLLASCNPPSSSHVDLPSTPSRPPPSSPRLTDTCARAAPLRRRIHPMPRLRVVQAGCIQLLYEQGGACTRRRARHPHWPSPLRSHGHLMRTIRPHSRQARLECDG